MPELPDVQVFKEYLDATALHRPIETTRVRDPSLLEGVTRQALARRLKGRPIETTRRHGKHLLARVGDGWLRLHFGMTGGLEFGEDRTEPDHTALALEFADGSRLAFLNQRRFGEIGWVDDVDGYVGRRELGPDALELDRRAFRERLEGRRGTIKGALTDQSLIAGLGNVYADEALFRAGVHPEATVDGLDFGQAGSIHRSYREVLERAIEGRGEDFPRRFLVPVRESGAECPRCGGTIVKIEVGGRSTYLCDAHQR